MADTEWVEVGRVLGDAESKGEKGDTGSWNNNQRQL